MLKKIKKEFKICNFGSLVPSPRDSPWPIIETVFSPRKNMKTNRFKIKIQCQGSAGILVKIEKFIKKVIK